ncbi:MAG: beta-propeller domain-containing protein [Acidimicrobiia bacterium]
MRRITLLLTALAMVVAACATDGSTATTTTTEPPAAEPGPVGLFASSLQVADSCDDLLEFYVDQALEIVTPWGLPGDGWWGPFPVEEGAMADGDDATDGAGAAPGGGEAGVDYSTTNVQETGVDEPDIVKTDGTHVFALLDGALRVAEVDGAEVAVVGEDRFGDVFYSSMLLQGDRLLLLGSGWSESPGIAVDEASDSIYPYPGGSAISTILELDVSDPADPEVLRTLRIDGSVVSARMVDDRVRLVTRSRPVGFEWQYPEGSGLRAEREALEANREIIRSSTIDQWLPYFVLTDETTGDETEGSLLDCGEVYLPPEASGVSTLSVLSFPLAGGGLGSRFPVGLVAEGETVYASGTHLYVATQRWMDWAVLAEAGDAEDAADEFTTRIHRFSITGARARYQASGEVPGFLIGQWAMSEYDGDLRVASTTNPWGWWSSDESESQLTVLRPDDEGRLATIGEVGGMGRTETIRAVRFIGPVGYIVTFRQTDPLYVIDVTDPTAPTIEGELKITGYSAYLHPVGDGLLLGVGQDATEEGRVLGTQFSLFDVSDPTDPQRVDQITIEDAWAEAEWDHKAFLWWEPESLAVSPFQVWRWDEDDESETFDTGAIAVRVSDGRLVDEGVLRNGLDGPVEFGEGKPQPSVDPYRSQVRRTIVIGDVLLTVGEGGIGVHDLESLETLEYVSWR